MKEIFKKLTLGDKILILSTLIISVISIILIPIFLMDNFDSKVAIVKVSNEVVAEIPINQNEEEEIHTFEFYVDNKKYEGSLVSKDGSVKLNRLPDEIVPLGIHQDMGWISSSYEILVALPIQLTVTIEEENNKSEFDAISY